MEVLENSKEDVKTQFIDLRSTVNIMRKELRNVRTKLESLGKIHKRYVNEINRQLRKRGDQNAMKEEQKFPSQISEEEEFAENLQDYFSVNPIGYLESPFIFKNATPRQPSVCQQAKAKLRLVTTTLSNPSHALQGLDQFSHIWLIFVFHENNQSVCRKGKVAPPRLNGKKVGVFATRSPHRVNPIGLSLVKLDKIEGDYLHISGIDMINGTPIIDIKPYIPCYDNPLQVSSDEGESEKRSEVVVVPDWINSPSIQQLTVRFTPTAQAQLNAILTSSEALKIKYPHIDCIKTILVSILKEDPRSVYRRSRCQDLLYHFKFDAFHLSCWVDDSESVVEIIKVRPLDT